jgi:EpsD family peptidyl-prolyl cis-trans isomerase
VRIVLLTVVTASVALLAACGPKKERHASQVAAKVNEEEISVHQINFMLQQQRGLRPEQVDTASRQVLEQLIDQELAVQQAIEAKVDRDPRVMQALEAARREVLARAWIELQAEWAAKPTPQDVTSYYAAKPALFKERRVYTLTEFAIQAPQQAVDTLRTTLANAKNAQSFADALRAANVSFTTSSGTRPAESLPLDLLDKLGSLDEGQGVLLPQPGGARALIITKVVSAPVSFEQARPAIEQFLANDARRKKVESDVKTLRAAARIEYVGKFAQATSAPAPPEPVSAPSTAAASEAATAVAPGAAPAPQPAASVRLDSDAVSKRLKLK